MSLKYEIIDGKIVDSSGNEIKENVSVNDLYYNSNQIKEIYFNGNKCNFVGLDKDKNFYLVLGEIKHKGIGYSKYTMFKLYPDTYRTMAEIPGELLNDDGNIDLITDSLANSFSNCYAITKIPKIINTNKSTNNNCMFYRCHSLLSIPKLDTGNVTNMRYMFYKCGSITSLDLSNWDTSKVTDMSGMFCGCGSLISLDVSKWNTSNVTNMMNMFGENSYGCNDDEKKYKMYFGCESIITLDVSNWNTSNVTNMKNLFASCNSLTSLDVSKWDTGKVTDMSEMFYSCYNLTSLDVSNWNTSNVTNMRYMFYSCYNLTTIIGVIDMKSCTNYQYMFKGSTKLTGVKLKNVPSDFDASKAGLSEGQYTIVS